MKLLARQFITPLAAMALVAAAPASAQSRAYCDQNRGGRSLVAAKAAVNTSTGYEPAATGGVVTLVCTLSTVSWLWDFGTGLAACGILGAATALSTAQSAQAASTK